MIVRVVVIETESTSGHTLIVIARSTVIVGWLRWMVVFDCDCDQWLPIVIVIPLPPPLSQSKYIDERFYLKLVPVDKREKNKEKTRLSLS